MNHYPDTSYIITSEHPAMVISNVPPAKTPECKGIVFRPKSAFRNFFGTFDRGKDRTSWKERMQELAEAENRWSRKLGKTGRRTLIIVDDETALLALTVYGSRADLEAHKEKEQCTLRKDPTGRFLSFGEYFDLGQSAVCVVKREPQLFWSMLAVKTRVENGVAVVASLPPDCVWLDYKSFCARGMDSTIILDNSYIIKILENIHTSRSKALAYFSPAGYGKSVLLSMIKSFYDVREKDSFEEVFKGMACYRAVNSLYRNRYLFLTFDIGNINVQCENVCQFEKSLRNYVVSRLLTFADIYAPELRMSFFESKYGELDCIAMLEKLVWMLQHGFAQVYVTIDDLDYASRYCPEGLPRSEIRAVIVKNIIEPLSSAFACPGFRMLIMGHGEIDPTRPIAHAFVGVSLISVPELGLGIPNSSDFMMQIYLNRKYVLSKDQKEVWKKLLVAVCPPWIIRAPPMAGTEWVSTDFQVFTRVFSLVRWFEGGFEVD